MIDDVHNSGSLTLKCMDRAPSIKTAIPTAAGFVTCGNQMPAIKSVANKSFKKPTTPMNHMGRP